MLIDTINLVNNPSKLGHLIIPPSQPERIPLAGATISGRENSEPSGEGKGEPPYANRIIIHLQNHHLGSSAESFIRLGQS